MNSLSLRKELFLTLVIALLSLCDLVTSLVAVWGFTTDDAYIAWIYARQLVNGNGLQWHVDLPRVEGYSNFLWVIIAATVMKVKLPLISTIKMISCISLAGGLFALYRLGRLFFSPLLAILPVFMFSHFIGVSWWTVSGMESVFYCALSLLLVWQCTVAFGYQQIGAKQTDFNCSLISTRAWIVTNCTLLLLALTRFEGVIWCIPILLFIVFHLKRCGIRTVFPESKIILLWLGITFSCFLLPYAMYFIWRWNYFGYLIPNSYSCKGLVPGQLFAVDSVFLITLLPLAIVSVPYFFSLKDSRHWLLWSPSVLYAILLWKANPVITYFLRLFLGPFALFTLLPVLGISHFLDYFKLHRVDTKIVITVTVVIFTLVFIPGNDLQYLHSFIRQYKERTQIRLAVANILNTQATPGATVFFGDNGIVPFTVRNDLRFIDTDCLNNPELAHAPYKENLALYAKYIATVVKPEWVITTYEPLQSQENCIFKLLRKEHFFEQYQLITQLQSGWVDEQTPGHHKKTIDYIFSVYKHR
ncbi:hypothetical protein [Legionella fallonii]|uniref:Protein LphB n=1 Tax=Legionella fallonii LLAP-10 TaxID=1212491 RepID=A0A098G044_9GAMM|nr:hypothetical protein [Legionella fallonii]CEG55843.1 conserved membrane protein of unknown function [Legionella fallonii LLAP-10]